MGVINMNGYISEDGRVSYFEYPIQVKFWDFESGHYVSGIAYHDEIICGCCGGIFELKDIYTFCPKDVIPLMVYNDWINLDKEIIGEEYN